MDFGVGGDRWVAFGSSIVPKGQLSFHFIGSSACLFIYIYIYIFFFLLIIISHMAETPLFYCIVVPVNSGS